MAGIEHTVDDQGVAAAIDVVEAAAQRQIVAEKMESFFQLEIEREIFREALCAGRAQKLLLVVEGAEGESGARLHGICEFELMNDGELEERKISPGEEAIGSVPTVGSRLLRTENGIVDIEIQRLIRAGAGSRVRAHDHVAFAEVVAERELESGGAIVARVFEDEISAGG